MSDNDDMTDLGNLVALVVHDLRNPVATVSANLSFVREVGVGDDPDVGEALEDVDTALTDLMRGLEQLGWIGRWLASQPAVDVGRGDLASSIQMAVKRSKVDATVETPDEKIWVTGGGNALARALELLLLNCHLHASPGSVVVRCATAGREAVVEVEDDGKAVADDLREHVFTVAGQNELKGRADGRYSRVAGLLALRAIAEAMGATLELDGEDGRAIFRLRLQRQE